MPPLPLPLPLPLAAPPHTTTAGAVGCNTQRRGPRCRKASVQTPVPPRPPPPPPSCPDSDGPLKRGEDLKVEESHRMITGCAVTRGNSEDPVGNRLGDMRQKRQERGARGKTAKHRKAGRRDVKCFDGGRERQVNRILFFLCIYFFSMALKKAKKNPEQS